MATDADLQFEDQFNKNYINTESLWILIHFSLPGLDPLGSSHSAATYTIDVQHLQAVINCHHPRSLL